MICENVWGLHGGTDVHLLYLLQMNHAVLLLKVHNGDHEI